MKSKRIVSGGLIKITIMCGNKDCPDFNKIFNGIWIRPKQLDMFFDAYGQGSEDDSDFCPKCNQLGLPEVGDERRVD